MNFKYNENIIWGCIIVVTLLCIFTLNYWRSDLSEIERLTLILLPVLGLVIANRIEKRYKKSKNDSK